MVNLIYSFKKKIRKVDLEQAITEGSKNCCDMTFSRQKGHLLINLYDKSAHVLSTYILGCIFLYLFYSS